MKALVGTFQTSFLTAQKPLSIQSNRTQTQKPVLNVRFKDIWHTKINPTQIWYDNSINKHYRLNIPTHTTKFNL